jgi:hypothetical protein
LWRIKNVDKRPLYFQWSVKMFVNNVNVEELNPVVSTGTVNCCNIIGISQLRRMLLTCDGTLSTS